MKNVLKKLWEWLKQVFTRNMGMKIGALVFAFLMWSFVQAEENLDRIKVFNDVTVTYTSADLLKQRGLTTAIPFSDIQGSVAMEVSTKADRLYMVTADTVSAEVDLSSITEPGEYTLPIRGGITVGNSRVERVRPTEVKVQVEAIVSKEIPVEVWLAGDRQPGLYYGEAVLDEKTVEVSGARSNVDQATKAICEIDISNLEAPMKETRSVTLLNEEGDMLPASMFTSTPAVIVELPVYPKKSVPVDVEEFKESITGGIAEGYEIKSVEISPDSVDIAGGTDDIADIINVKLADLELEDAKDSQAMEVDVVLPEGVYAVSPAHVEVAISITPTLIESSYPAVDIAVKNLGDGLEATLYPGSIDIGVKGTKEKIDPFSAELLKPFVDAQGLTAGVYSIELKFENEPDLGVELSPSVRNVAVTISRVQD